MASLIAAVVVAALIALAFKVAGGSGDSDASTPGVGERSSTVASILDEDLPRLEDLTSAITVPPGPADGLSVVDSGVSIVEDRFDAAKREGTFAAVIDNPHADWIAQGVQVTVEFLDDAGTVVGTDSGFVELVLPMQRVAVSSLFFDAPTTPVANTRVSLDVAGWRQATVSGGDFITSEVTTEEAEFSGVRTSFLLRSTFPESLRDVGVTAVFRNAEGAIVGGYDTFVDLLEPDVDTPVQIALLANIPITEIASTELYPYATATPAP